MRVKNNSLLRTLLLLILSISLGCKTTQKVKSPPKPLPQKEKPAEKTEAPEENFRKISPEKETDHPSALREFRGVWVATVANINWPSKPGLNSEDQKSEALKILEAADNSNLNAIILQVRPQADALYNSQLEPWSYYLTGKSGKEPMPFYDPLNFWIEEAHKRGLELHVWLNPYRAHHTTAGEIGEQSVIKKHPDWVVELKNGMWWMDPSNENVQDYTVKVVMDIVKRYDIDAIHFDDYFYPYASYNGKNDFPDTQAWQAYQLKGGELSRADWRRDNVDRFLKRVGEEIKREKPYVKFGISPFGIWRPDFPAGIKGMDQYDELYADAKLWLNKGWIDYFTPQLYWSTRQMGQSFPVLLGWWDSENVTSRHLWPGVNLSLEEKDENKGEITSQVMISRGILRDDPGVVLWNISSLMKNKVLDSSLLQGPYQKKSLVPSSPWLDDEPPLKPELRVENTGSNIQLYWQHKDVEDVFRWVLYFKYEDEKWDYYILNENDRKYSLKLKNNEGQRLKAVGLTAVDRTGNESHFSSVLLNEEPIEK